MDRDTLLVIVGAGASHACQGAVPEYVETEGLPRFRGEDVRPPLTQTLVGPGPLQDAVLARYWAARPLVAELREALVEGSVTSFEQLLADYERSADENPARQSHLVALRFYLRDLLWACTSYATKPVNGSGLTRYDRLLNELHHWATRHSRHVCIVNFNYDLILETACDDVFGFGRWPFGLGSYLADPHVSVLKPHGSVNWAWEVYEEDTRGLPTSDPRTITLARDGLELVPNSLHTEGWAPHLRTSPSIKRGVIPALALPVANKHDFVWPAEQLTFLEGLRSNVRAVITLGWRGLEPHFLNLLPPLVREASAFLVTGGPEGRADAEALKSRLTEKAHIVRWSIDPGGLPVSLQPYLDWFDSEIDWRQGAA